MTRYFTIKVLTTCFLFLVFFSANSQDMEPEPYLNPSFGPDSVSRVECANDLSTLAEFMKIDLPDYALPSWRRLYANCPSSRKNIYISGAKIFQYLIEKESDETRKAELYDTLMMIYDKRIEYFGDEGYVQGRKGVDIVRYNPDDYPQAYEAFRRSTELMGPETDINVLTGLVQTSGAMFRQNKITAEEFLKDYITTRGIYAELARDRRNIPKVRRAESMTEKILTNSGLKDCDALENVLGPELKNSSFESGLVKLTLDLLTLSGCENTAFYASINEELMKQDPDPEVAYEVARFNIQNENYDKAISYLKQAVELEESRQKKAQYLYQVAVIHLSKLSDPSGARDYAMEAAANDPNYGEPYLLVAAALVEGIRKCDLEEFDKRAIYWLATDYCIRAKSVDPSLNNKANELISQYQQRYPTVEDMFFRSLSEGDSYRIGCWIQETTRVKKK